MTVPLTITFDAEAFTEFVLYSLSQITTLRTACYELATMVGRGVALNQIDPARWGPGDLTRPI